MDGWSHIVDSILSGLRTHAHIHQGKKNLFMLLYLYSQQQLRKIYIAAASPNIHSSSFTKQQIYTAAAASQNRFYTESKLYQGEIVCMLVFIYSHNIFNIYISTHLYNVRCHAIEAIQKTTTITTTTTTTTIDA